MTPATVFEQDMQATLKSRELLESNPNLMYWYQRLFQRMFAGEGVLAGKVILEVGSGASPLKQILPSVITSDVMPLAHLDHVFDCHEIHRYPGIADHSVDIVVLTNVLHHLKDPLAFLKSVGTKLRPGAKLIMAEPYISALSWPIYKMLHPEPVNFGIQAPVLDRIEGPLSTSNQAMPHMIFFSRPAWLGQLSESFDLAATRIEYFSSLSYMMTGGISHRLPVPCGLYKRVFPLDGWLADKAPRLFASFFIAKLVSPEA